MRSSILIAVLITLVTLAWVGSGMVGATDDPQEAADALRPPMADQTHAAIPTVRVQEMSAQSRVRSLTLLGQTRASRAIEVRAETAGRVVEIGDEEGTLVPTGAMLARLAVDDRMERLSQAEAAVARWEDRTKADQRLANQDFTSRQRVLESKAALEDARAALAAILLDIDRTEIKAPFDAMLETRHAEVGDYIGVGDTVAHLVDLDPLDVVVHVPEADIGAIRRDQAGEVTLIDGRVETGAVSYIAPVADGVTRTFAVRISLPNPGHRVPQGMTASVRLPLESSRAIAISPALLALDEDGRIGVKLVDEDHRVLFHPVTISGDGDQGLWVTGLPDPATLITVGQEFVTAGQRVNVIHAEEIEANSEALAAADRAALDSGKAPTASIETIEVAPDADEAGGDRP
jgi:multidrug efflux system membrane fusion protein